MTTPDQSKDTKSEEQSDSASEAKVAHKETPRGKTFTGKGTEVQK